MHKAVAVLQNKHFTCLCIPYMCTVFDLQNILGPIYETWAEQIPMEIVRPYYNCHFQFCGQIYIWMDLLTI